MFSNFRTESTPGSPGKIACMKKLLFAILTISWVSCSVSHTANEVLGEDELFITRKYVGNYLDYRHTGSEDFAGPNIIWIKTSLDSIYGKIAAYGKKCDFTAGDRLYLKRVYSTPGVMGYWTYQIENDSSLFYEVMKFQSGKDYFIEELF
jgi:hypothetical protein